MPLDHSDDLLEVISLEAHSGSADRDDVVNPVDVSANLTDGSQSDMCNGWIAMLRWYELQQQPLIH